MHIVAIKVILFLIFQYCLTDKPQLKEFDPEKTSLQKYPITQFQPVYFVAETFEDAKERVRYKFKKNVVVVVVFWGGGGSFLICLISLAVHMC